MISTNPAKTIHPVHESAPAASRDAIGDAISKVLLSEGQSLVTVTCRMQRNIVLFG
jgi:hypothetical protein